MKAKMRFTIEVMAGSQLSSVQIWSCCKSLRVWPMEERAFFLPHYQAPRLLSQLEKTIQGSQGCRNQVKGLSTCTESLIGSQRKAAWCWGPESDRACASETLEGEQRQGANIMESFKSTWRAIRFLSMRGGQNGAEGLWLQLEGIQGLVYSLVLFLITGVGVLVRGQGFLKSIPSFRRECAGAQDILGCHLERGHRL